MELFPRFCGRPEITPVTLPIASANNPPVLSFPVQGRGAGNPNREAAPFFLRLFARHPILGIMLEYLININSEIVFFYELTPINDIFKKFVTIQFAGHAGFYHFFGRGIILLKKPPIRTPDRIHPGMTKKAAGFHSRMNFYQES
ncbi:MAG: hypothetical protein JXB25_07605 [Deltaproteobacteria bacterium]|nr:hypothetical protein [Deltaproteobacteria bacterium]